MVGIGQAKKNHRGADKKCVQDSRYTYIKSQAIKAKRQISVSGNARMEARSERKDGVLIFTVNGKLDAFGAQRLEEWVRAALHDDDHDLVIDMAQSPYLSSGGIRTFNGLKKEMKRRNGRFAIAAAGDYPRKVLDIAGFSTIFDLYPTTDDAVRDIVHKRKNPTLFNELFYKKIEAEGIKLTVESGWMTTPPVLRVLGDLNKILHARIAEGDIREKKFSEITYSLGLGSIGTDREDAMQVMGEMITLYGSMIWLPTDGHSTPDFLTPMDMGGEVPVYTGYNIALDGPFNEYFTLDTTDPEGVSLNDIYRTIFSSARDRVKTYHGVIAITIWGVLANLASSGLKKAPVISAGLPEGTSIMDPSNLHSWVAADEKKTYKGDTLVSFGIGIDLGSDLSFFPEEGLSSLYYHNTMSRARAKQMYLHNHGVVFRNVPYDPSLDLNSQVKRIVSEGEFIDMRHLLDTTRRRKAKIGVAYIQKIARDA
jgi:anti-anti-sigma factor